MVKKANIDLNKKFASNNEYDWYDKFDSEKFWIQNL